MILLRLHPEQENRSLTLTLMDSPRYFLIRPKLACPYFRCRLSTSSMFMRYIDSFAGVSKTSKLFRIEPCISNFSFHLIKNQGKRVELSPEIWQLSCRNFPKDNRFSVASGT